LESVPKDKLSLTFAKDLIFLRRVIDEKLLLKEMENRNLDRKLAIKMKIYFLREFDHISLNELAVRFKKQSKNISKIHLNFKK
jgi:hypothetical protein